MEIVRLNDIRLGFVDETLGIFQNSRPKTQRVPMNTDTLV